MRLTIACATKTHVDDIGRIGFEAFRNVAVTHGLLPDFPNVNLARQVYQMLVERSDYYGVVALVDGRPVGSNFLSITDEVSGVGPLSIDPAYQGNGIGKTLMEDVLGFAQKHNIQQIRLLQDAHNLASLSLYSSLGFVVRDAIALVTAVPAPKADRTIRPINAPDLPAIDRLSTSLYKSSRRNEVIITMQYGFPALIREREGRIVGYLLPGLVGHGASETEDDTLALAREAARTVPPVFARLFCPLRYPTLFQSLLKAGGKVEKTLTYMTLGPYAPPTGCCTPSASY
jgi:predicted N-acetyltransferase YhbS